MSQVRKIGEASSCKAQIPPLVQNCVPIKPMGSFPAHVESTVQLGLTTIVVSAGWLDNPTNHMETSDQA